MLLGNRGTRGGLALHSGEMRLAHAHLRNRLRLNRRDVGAFSGKMS